MSVESGSISLILLPVKVLYRLYNPYPTTATAATVTAILTIGTAIKYIEFPYTTNYINLYWSISDTKWSIYIFDNNNDKIKNRKKGT